MVTVVVVAVAVTVVAAVSRGIKGSHGIEILMKWQAGPAATPPVSRTAVGNPRLAVTLAKTVS